MLQGELTGFTSVRMASIGPDNRFRDLPKQNAGDTPTRKRRIIQNTRQFLIGVLFLRVLVVVVQAQCSTAAYRVNGRQEERQLSFQSENLFECNL